MIDYRSEWVRTRRARPCPICEKPNWCLIAADESAAICARIKSTHRCGDAGWLHRLRDNFALPRAFTRKISLESCPQPDFTERALTFEKAVNAEHLRQHASSLGLSVESLTALGVGWAQPYDAWSFPMCDAHGAVRGIRLRRSNGAPGYLVRCTGFFRSQRRVPHQNRRHLYLPPSLSKGCRH